MKRIGYTNKKTENGKLETQRPSSLSFTYLLLKAPITNYTFATMTSHMSRLPYSQVEKNKFVWLEWRAPKKANFLVISLWLATKHIPQINRCVNGFCGRTVTPVLVVLLSWYWFICPPTNQKQFITSAARFSILKLSAISLRWILSLTVIFVLVFLTFQNKMIN